MKVQFAVAYIILFVFCFHCSSNNKMKVEYNISGNESLITIRIEDKINNLIQSDSLFEFFKAIPLETSSECLLNKPVKVVIHDHKIFIQDHNNVLYVFNIDGSFIRQIGNKGRGPEEFITLSDFDFDSLGNIYIIDRSKIVKYSSNGDHIRSFPLHYNTGGFICYPEQLIVRDSSRFIIWGGSSGILENKNEDLYAMYEISESGEILSGYFPLVRKIDNRRHRFREFNQEHLIDPLYGIDTIFSISKDTVYAKYHIDFGKYRITREIPRNLTDFSAFKQEVDECCASTIMNFTEINDWIYFVFRYQGLAYFNYYSKSLKKTFTCKYSSNSLPQNSIVWKIDSGWEDSFITLIEPAHIIEQISRIDNMNRLSKKDKVLIESLESIDELDNPVLFIVKMKDYS
jgi:hypothetical protein